MQNLTKQQEIDILDAAIEKLGTDSYLGPWLKSVKAELAALVKCDIFPDAMDVSLAASRDAASKIKTAATDEAERIVNSAEEKARKIKDDAARYIDNQREYALKALDAAMDVVKKI